MVEPSHQQEMIAFRDRAARLGAVPRMTRMKSDGSVRMALLDYQDFSGKQDQASYITLNLCTRGTGRYARQSCGINVAGNIRPGTFGLILPDDGADVRWSRMQMLGIGFDPTTLGNPFEGTFTHGSLADAASVLHHDPLLTSVMTALWRDGEAHGLSSAFFDHGLVLILRHLQRGQAISAPQRRNYALSGARLQRVLDLIEARLAQDVSVADMAREAEQDMTSFSRAFKAATGLAPFQYLTRRRMDHAIDRLRRGESVTATALAVGYSNPSKFASAFRRATGLLPSELVRNE